MFQTVLGPFTAVPHNQPGAQSSGWEPEADLQFACECIKAKTL